MRTHVQAGRLAKTSGDMFEAFLEAQHEKAKYWGILAHVIHNEPKTKIIGGRLIYVARSGADYSAVLTRGARAAAIEAKSTSDKRFYKSEVEALQQKHLDAVDQAGGLALLAVEFRTQEGYKRFAIPWRQIPWEKARTAESVQPDQLTAWAIATMTDSCYLERFHPRQPVLW